MSTPLLKRRVNQTEYVDHPLGPTTTTIGRSRECDIAIEDTSLSRLHLRVEKRGASYFVVDNNSSNGTFVNRRKVTEAPLINGDEVVAGRIHFYFHLKELAEGSVTRPMPAMTVSRTISANLEDFPSVENMMPPNFEETQTSSPEALRLPPPRLPPDPPALATPAVPGHSASRDPYAMPPAPPMPPPMPPPMASPYAAPSARLDPGFKSSAAEASVLATPMQRLLAYLIDVGLVFGVMLVAVVIGFISPILAMIVGIPLYLALMAHPIVGWLKYRKTLGKHIIGLEIEELEQSNTPGLSPRAVLLRVVGMFVVGLTFGLGFVLIFTDPNRQGLHDKIAGTRVIQRKR